MSIFQAVSINPFIQGEVFTSYHQNIGEKFPVMYIKDIKDSFSIYDGILKVGKYSFKMSDYKMADLSNLLNSLGYNTSIYPDTENIDCLQLINFSNSDIVKTIIDRSPIDAGLLKSPYLIDNILDDYKNNVSIQIIQNGLKRIEVKNLKIYTDSDDINKYIVSSHFANTFILHASDKVLYRNHQNISNHTNVKEALITANIKLKGKDNADYNL